MEKQTRAIVVMKYALGFSLLVVTFTTSACNDINNLFQGRGVDANKSKAERKEAGRYQIHGTQKETLLFDSSTGRTWVLSQDKGEMRWTVVHGGADTDPLGIRGEITKRYRILAVQEPDGKIIRYDKQGNPLPDDPKQMTDKQLLEALGIDNVDTHSGKPKTAEDLMKLIQRQK